jgi:hypothetical protein
MSQPSPRVIVFPLTVLIVRTPLLIVQYPVCVPLPSVAIVTIPVPDSLLSLMDYCSHPPIVSSASCTFLLSLLSASFYCLVFLLFLSLLIALLGFTALDGLAI